MLEISGLTYFNFQHILAKYYRGIALKYNLKLIDQLLLSYKFHGRDIEGIYFLIFASCEPLMFIN